MAKDTLPLWRKIQRQNFTCIDSLCEFLQIPEDRRDAILPSSKFVLNLPLRLASKIEKNNFLDPLFLQFVPLSLETLSQDGFVKDPVTDTNFCKTSKMLQKYRSRALLVTTSACVMHCRFCFRQNFPYETSVQGFTQELEILQQDSSIEEVILSGGDPLSLSNFLLKGLFEEFEKIKHIKRVRFHTRFPIGIPERIDEEFLQILQNTSKQVFFVIHCNHPKELDDEVVFYLKKVHKAGAVLLNQTVLLKNVNDDKATLLLLCQELASRGIIPYYLHKLDKVLGTSHFLVEDEKAIELMQYLQENLSGYALPRLVQEIPGKPSKTIVF